MSPHGAAPAALVGGSAPRGCPWCTSADDYWLAVMDRLQPEELVNLATVADGVLSRRLSRTLSHLRPVTRGAASAPVQASGRDAGGSLRPRMHDPADDASLGPELTADDLEFFSKNGYLVKRKLIEPRNLQVCLDKFWDGAPASIRREDPSSWIDVDKHDDWETCTPVGYERVFDNRGYRGAGQPGWTRHGLGTDPGFLAATAHHPSAFRVVEALIGGPIALPQRNRGIYAIFPVSVESQLNPHVDSHTFECQMVTYLGPVGDDSGGKLLQPPCWLTMLAAYLSNTSSYTCRFLPHCLSAVQVSQFGQEVTD